MAELENIKDQLGRTKSAVDTGSSDEDSTVVYEQAGAVADYEFAVATMSDVEFDDGLSQAV